jgi:peptidoglycan hydrolase-like protein with peptidoglycan-binding domain
VHEDTEETEPNPLAKVVKRQRTMLWITVVALVLSIAGLVLSFFIKSPGQRLLETAPPPPSVITAPVEQKELVKNVTIRGTVSAERIISVFAPTNVERVVVAKLKPTGETIQAGEVLAEVSGRPIIALSGDTAAYRDVNPGTSGKDVTQLQNALAALGLYSGDIDGVFGYWTQDALSTLYKNAGFDPPTTADQNPGEADSIIAAQSSVTAAQRAVEDARSADHPDPTAVQRANEDLTAAQSALNRLNAQTGVRLPLGEVVFLPEGTGIVAGHGSADAGPNAALLTVQTGRLQVNGTLPSGLEAEVQTDMAASVSDEINQRETRGKVTNIAEFVAGGTDDNGMERKAGYPVIVTPEEPLGPEWLNADVAIRIQTAASDGPVLAVPVVAIGSRADDSRFVRVADADGTTHEVDVSVGIIAEGFAQVKPTTGSLRPGDEVIVS